MKLSELMKGIDYNGNIQDCDIHTITHDSRKVKIGSLFVAINGMEKNGNDFIPEAIKNGAAAILSDGDSNKQFSVPNIKVLDARKTLSLLSANLYGHPSKKINVIGVTGTNGKTSVTQIINAILKQSKIISGTLGTLGFTTPSGILNTGFTTPEATEIQHLFKTLIDGGVDHLIMEVSSHSLHLKRVSNIDFNVAVFTNLTEDHLDFHGNMNNYFASKLSLFKKLNKNKIAIINNDDPWAQKIFPELFCKTLSYGMRDNADLYPINYNLSIDGIQAELKYKKQIIKLNSPLIGKYNLYNIMAAVATSLILKVSIENIEIALSKLDTIPGRMEKFFIKNKGNVIIDYAHTPDAYEQIFTTIKKLLHKNIKVITIFGCGGNRDNQKRPKMAKIVEKFSDETIITTDNPRNEKLDLIIKDIKSGFRYNNYTVIENREKAIHHGINQMDGKSLLMLFGKGREKYQIINEQKFAHSDIEIIKSFMV